MARIGSALSNLSLVEAGVGATEARVLTAIYWVTAVLFASAFWVARFPPLVDYPNHLAIAALLHRVWAGDAAARAVFEIDLFTPNGAFQVSTALLSFVVSIEAAGKIVLSIIVLLWAVGCLRLIRGLGRPAHLAFIPLQVAFGHTLCFGFLNFSLSLPFVAWTLARWLDLRREPGKHSIVSLVVLASILPWLHMLAPAIVGLSAAIVVIGEAEWDVRRVPQLVASLARNTWYFVPGVLTALALAMHGRASVHTNWSSPAKDGTDIPAWEKIIGFPRFVVGNFYDDSDRLLFILTSMVALGLCLHRFGDPEARPARRLATLWAIAFMLLPRVLFSTWFFSDRLATLVVIFGAASLPRASSSIVRRSFAAFALLAGGNTVLHFAILPEQNHAAAILAAIPKDRRVLGLYFLRDGAPAFSRAIWTHFEGFHTVLGGGDTGQSFLDVESCPIHYRKGMSPPRPPANLEIAPEHYDPDAPYARAFDVLLVRSVTDPRRQLLGARADQGRILAGIGLFWVIDTAGLGVGPTVSPPGALP